MSPPSNWIWINGSKIYFQTKIHTIIVGGTKWGKRGVRTSSACVFYRTFGAIYILKSSVLLHFCRSGPTDRRFSGSLPTFCDQYFWKFPIWNSRADEKRWEIWMIKVNVIFNDIRLLICLTPFCISVGQDRRTDGFREVCIKGCLTPVCTTVYNYFELPLSHF
jgi:hypothetical protein